MVKLSSISEIGKKKISIDLGDDEVLNLTVLPNMLTLNLEKALSAAQEENDSGQMAEAFFTVVKDWDLTDDEGNVLPRSEETIGQIGVGIVAQIMEDISSIVLPKSPTEISSGGGSNSQK